MILFYVSVEQSYRDFNADLYPDTFSGVPTVTCAEWLNGETKAVSCVFPDDHSFTSKAYTDVIYSRLCG